MKNQAKREMQFEKVTSTILRETEKAYRLSVSYWTKTTAKDKEAKMWCPKSCCKVEDGKVVEVATFILDQWCKEHNEFCKQYTSSKHSINFDMEEKARVLAAEKEEVRQRKEWLADAERRIYNYVKPFTDEFMKSVAARYAAMSKVLKENGSYLSEQVLEDMSSLANRIASDFGIDREMEEKVYSQSVSINLDEHKCVCYLDDMVLRRGIFGKLIITSDKRYYGNKDFSYDEFQIVRIWESKKFAKNNAYKEEADRIIRRIGKECIEHNNK